MVLPRNLQAAVRARLMADEGLMLVHSRLFRDAGRCYYARTLPHTARCWLDTDLSAEGHLALLWFNSLARLRACRPDGRAEVCALAVHDVQVRFEDPEIDSVFARIEMELFGGGTSSAALVLRRGHSGLYESLLALISDARMRRRSSCESLSAQGQEPLQPQLLALLRRAPVSEQQRALALLHSELGGDVLGAAVACWMLSTARPLGGPRAPDLLP